ncbi:MAG: aminoglycoside phosphotransferase family protein [Chitinispirillales bacterium]|jgi:hypothetical protein|nr:aminoglycoside phosphotransferase family protein [Chitinispirillales bacterium]
MKKRIVRGRRSVVYKYGGIIIKKARGKPGTNDYDNYIKHQVSGYEVIKRLLESGEPLGVGLPELVSINADTREIRERLLPGVKFTGKLYNSLSRRSKEKAAQDMAEFLNAMHQLQEPQRAGITLRKYFNRFKTVENPNLDAEIISEFIGKLSPSSLRLINAAETYFCDCAYSSRDEAAAITHHDLREDNLIYDKRSRKLFVIDFEGASLLNIYWNFIPRSPTSVFIGDFARSVIERYNALNKKYPVLIDNNKIKHASVYSMTIEFFRLLCRDNIAGRSPSLSFRAVQFDSLLERF